MGKDGKRSRFAFLISLIHKEITHNTMVDNKDERILRGSEKRLRFFIRQNEDYKTLRRITTAKNPT